MPVLHLLRHAKSDWSDASARDRDRPLNRRGRRARLVIARHVAGWPVDLVVTSDARRARETAGPLAEALGAPLRVEPRLYDDGDDPGRLLDLVRELPADAGAVVLVGHNPGIEELAALLDPAAPPFPTAALASFDLGDRRWAEVAPRSAALVGFVTARGLEADEA